VSGNDSGFTAANPVAPEGGQVAFVQNKGAIRQRIGGFVAGRDYTITLAAAQRANIQSSRQTFEIRVDDRVIATITPGSTRYEDVSVTFTASGSTVALQFAGTNPEVGDNTVSWTNCA
jgi:hypothetical protein